MDYVTRQTIKLDILPLELFETGQITPSSDFGGWFYLLSFLFIYVESLKNHNKS